MNNKWNNAELYELYIGRWSRLTALEFLKWLDPESSKVWLEIGCGTGALSEAILQTVNPEKVIGIDPSEEQIRFVKNSITDKRAEFHTGEAEAINIENSRADVLVSALVLNFIPDLNKALAEFKRVVKKGGIVAGYVWDYSGRMELIRYFWDAAVKLFDDARDKDEARFKICNPKVLADVFNSAGFKDTEVTFLYVPTVFRDFNDYWEPFLSGIGPAPGYCMSLSEADRERLKSVLHKTLPIDKDGSIHLIARAIAVRANI